MSWQDHLKSDSLSWLLQPDAPGVRYLALRDLRHSLRELHQLVMHEARTADAAKLRRSGQALARARQELEAILTERPERG